jgi:hypothetical protein
VYGGNKHLWVRDMSSFQRIFEWIIVVLQMKTVVLLCACFMAGVCIK